MARYGTRADAEVNRYLDSIRQDRWEQGGGEGGGVYVRGWAPSPYILSGEDPDDPAVRARIAKRLGVQNPEGQVEYPDETEDPIAPWVMAAMMAFAGGAAGGVGASAAGTSSTPSWMQPMAGGVADTGYGAGVAAGAEGTGYSVVPGATGSTITTGASAGTGAASWLPAGITPQMAMAGAGLGISAAGAMNGGGAEPNFGNLGGQGRPSYFGLPYSTPGGTDVWGNSTEAMSNAGYGGSGYGPSYASGLSDAASSALPSGGNFPWSKFLEGTASASDWGNAVGGLAGIGSGIYGMTQANNLKNPIDFSSGAPGNINFTSGALDFSSMLPTGGKMDFSAADPWGTSGGRGVAGEKLKTLLSDPSALYSMPGWAAGQEAVQRSMAAQGYTGSGNMMAALQKYGGDYYNQALQQLTTLSGGAQDPSTISKLELSQQGQNQQQQQAAAQLSLSQLNSQNQMALQQRGQNQQLQLGGAQLNTQREIAGNTLASQSLASLGYGGQRLLGGPQQQQMDPNQFRQMMSLYNMGRGMV